MVFAFAISQLCAGNPALPQSVPSSVLLNFFMTIDAYDADAGERPASPSKPRPKGAGVSGRV
jgi:hypothetical protein